MLKVVRPFLLVVAASVCALALGQSVPKPELSLSLPTEPVAPGANFEATLVFTLDPGFHAYQNPPSDPSNIPLSVEAGAGTTLRGARYPKGVAKPFPGFETPLAMYEGTVRVPVTLTAPSAPGKHTAELKVRYQICDDSNCWPPATGTVQAQYTVASAAVSPPPPPPPAGTGLGTAPTGPPAIRAFVASSEEVPAGTAIVLSWQTANASEARLTIGSESFPVRQTGTHTVTVSADTTIVLEATGAGGAPASRSLTVRVLPPSGAATSQAEPPGEPPAPADPVPAGTEGGAPPAAAVPEGGDATADSIKTAMSQGLGPYLLLAFFAGLAALATPCVWPMIPITVSFFSKRGEGGKKDLRGSLAYSLGIMATFTMLGIAVSAVFGAAGIQRLAANVWVNLGLTAVFVVLALGLFGVLDFALPQGFVDKFSKGSRTKQGLLGPILMGVTFTLTSFTCTVPFVGTLLVSVAGGNFLYPVLGMLAFSFAFAVPFFLLAMFPQWLASLPKSGSWLSSTKAYLGFLELAAALKFLSNVDLAWNWGLLTKPAFLAVWVVLFSIAGFWLVGALRLPHADGPDPKVGVGRRVFGFVNIALAGYLLTAMNGAPLGQLVGFLPPDPYPGQETAVASQGTAEPTGHLAWVKDYEAAVAKANQEGKLLLLNFTGDFCVNCRVMENTVFPDPEVAGLMRQAVPVWLVTDREDENSRANAALRERLTKSVTNPVYVIQKPSGEVVTIQGGATQGPKPFAEWLRKGLAGGV